MVTVIDMVLRVVISEVFSCSAGLALRGYRPLIIPIANTMIEVVTDNFFDYENYWVILLSRQSLMHYLQYEFHFLPL